jgi:site-specific DNA recombinase
MPTRANIVAPSLDRVRRSVRPAATRRVGWPNPSQAPLVQEAFELYPFGVWPLNRLHEAMAERGFAHEQGATLCRSKLAELPKNTAYVGKGVCGGIEYEGIHKPLVSQELFDRVQEVFRLHNRAGQRRRRHDHYLRATLFRGTCGSRLRRLTAKCRFPCFGPAGQDTPR